MINDKNSDGARRRFQLEPQLFLDSFLKRGSVLIRLGVRAGGLWGIGLPLNGEVKTPDEARAVNHRKSDFGRPG